MLDPIAMKHTALGACLKPLGDFLEATGLQRPLADYSHEEVLALVEVVINAYQDSMQAQHEHAVTQEQVKRPGAGAGKGENR